MLIGRHRELGSKKATGVDDITKEAFEHNLADNISRLHQALKTMAYRPQAVKRVYIPKAGSAKK